LFEAGEGTVVWVGKQGDRFTGKRGRQPWNGDGLAFDAQPAGLHPCVAKPDGRGTRRTAASAFEDLPPIHSSVFSRSRAAFRVLRRYTATYVTNDTRAILPPV